MYPLHHLKVVSTRDRRHLVGHRPIIIAGAAICGHQWPTIGQQSFAVSGVDRRRTTGYRIHSAQLISDATDTDICSSTDMLGQQLTQPTTKIFYLGYTISGDVANDSSFLQCKIYADIRGAARDRERQTTVELSKTAIFSTFTRYFFRSFTMRPTILILFCPCRTSSPNPNPNPNLVLWLGGEKTLT